VKSLADKIVNLTLSPFGRCRVKLRDWPEDNVSRIIAAIKQKGGIADGTGGMIGFDEYYFRLPGGRVKLTVIEYGEAYLWGRKRLVRELVSLTGT
jgi:hypothetical protein